MKDDELYVFSAEETADISSLQKQWEVLIVDPDSHNVAAIKNFLESKTFQEKKFSVEGVSSFSAAKAYFESHKEVSLLLLNASIEKKLLLDGLQKIRADQENFKVRILLLGSENICPIPAEEIFQYDVHSYIPLNDFNNNFFIAVTNALIGVSFNEEFLKKKSAFQEMQEASQRFVPTSFLKLLNHENIVDIQLTDHLQKEMTVLFLDIRSFTSISEFLTPVETFEFINDFLSYLEPSVSKHHGFIDKYIGDSVMAIFPERPEDAVLAGLEMLKALERYNVARISKYQIPIKIGIGINTGMLVLGVIGFYDRMECTVISDAVNTASRIESLTKRVGATVLISESTYHAIQNFDQMDCRLLGNMAVPGKHEFVAVYEVFGNDPKEVASKKLETKPEFERAVQLFNALNFSEANAIFSKIFQINPHDLVAKYFMEKTLLVNENKEGFL